MKNPIPRPQAGFTLMELMITIAIAAVLLALAAPNMGDFIKNNRMTSETNNLVAQINRARGEAAKRGVIVILCRSTNPTATAALVNCDSGAGNAKNWTTGWIMYSLDSASTTERDFVLATDQLLARTATLDNGIRITTNGYAESRLAIRSDGTLLETGATRFALCDDRNEGPEGNRKGRVVEVSLTGRPTIARTDGAGTATDCTPAD